MEYFQQLQFESAADCGSKIASLLHYNISQRRHVLGSKDVGSAWIASYPTKHDGCFNTVQVKDSRAHLSAVFVAFSFFIICKWQS